EVRMIARGLDVLGRAPAISLGGLVLRRHPVCRVRAGVVMLLKAQLNRQTRDILPPRLCNAAEPVAWRVKRDALGARVDFAVKEEAGAVTINADEVGDAEDMDHGANRVLASAQIRLEIKRVKALVLWITPRRSLVEALAVHIERVARIRADAHDRGG